MTSCLIKNPKELCFGILKVFNWVTKRNLIKLNNVRSRHPPYCLHRCGFLVHSLRMVSFQGCCGTKPSPSGNILWCLYCSSYVSPLLHNIYWMVTFIAKMGSIDFCTLQWLRHRLLQLALFFNRNWELPPQDFTILSILHSLEILRVRQTRGQQSPTDEWHQAGLKSSQAIHSVVRIDKSRVGFQLQQLNRTSTGLHSAHNLISTQDTRGGLLGIVGGWRERTWVNWML